MHCQCIKRFEYITCEALVPISSRQSPRTFIRWRRITWWKRGKPEPHTASFPRNLPIWMTKWRNALDASRAIRNDIPTVCCPLLGNSIAPRGRTPAPPAKWFMQSALLLTWGVPCTASRSDGGTSETLTVIRSNFVATWLLLYRVARYENSRIFGISIDSGCNNSIRISHIFFLIFSTSISKFLHSQRQIFIFRIFRV